MIENIKIIEDSDSRETESLEQTQIDRRSPMERIGSPQLL